MDKIAGLFGFSGVSSAGSTSSFDGSSNYGYAAEDSVSFSGAEAINAYGNTGVASLDDSSAEVRTAGEKAQNAGQKGAAAGNKAAEAVSDQIAAASRANAAAQKSSAYKVSSEEADAKVNAAKSQISKIKAEGEIKGKEANTESALQSLNKEMAELNKERQAKIQEKERQEARQSRLVEDLAEAQADGNKSRANELRSELGNVNQKLAGLQDDLESLNGRQETLKGSIDSAQSKLEQEKADKAKAQQDKLDTAQDARQSAEAEASEARQNQQSASSESSQANQEASQSAQQASQAQAQSDQAKTEASQAGSKVAQLEAEYQAARAEADAAAQAAAQADQEVSAAQAALSAAQSSAVTVENEDGTSSQVQDDSAIASAQGQLDAAQAAADAAHAEAEAAEAKAADLESQLEAAKAEAANAEGISEEKAAESAEAQSAAEQSRTSADAAQTKAAAADRSAEETVRAAEEVNEAADSAVKDKAAEQSASQNAVSAEAPEAVSSDEIGDNSKIAASEAEAEKIMASEEAEAPESALQAKIKEALNLAGSMEGLSEHTDADALNKFIAENDPKSWGIDCQENAWCAAFASSVLNKTGVMDFENCYYSDNCEDLKDWAKGEGTWRTNDGSYIPSAGSMMIFDDADEAGSHVGIVTGYDEETGLISTIEGNADDQVKRCEYSSDYYNPENGRVIAGYIEPNVIEETAAASEASEVKAAETAASEESEASEGVMQARINEALKLADSMKGLSEYTDAEAINKFIAENDPKSWGIDCQQNAWCAAFASSVLNKTGVMDFENCYYSDNCENLKDWAKGEGTWRTNDGSYIPSAGSMMIFDDAGMPGSHVGIVVGYDEDTGLVTTIEGNANDQVEYRQYPFDYYNIDNGRVIAGFIEPNISEETAAAQVSGSEAQAASESQSAEKSEAAAQIDRENLPENIAAALEDAFSMEGLGEGEGHEIINAFISANDPWGLDCTEYDWCAAFASSVLNKYGIMDFEQCEYTDGCPALKTWAQNIDTWRENDGTYAPSPGSMMIYDDGKGNWDSPCHVGIVVSYDPETNTVTTIEGNTSGDKQDGDQVAVKVRTLDWCNENGRYIGGFIEPNA